ncbi:MAG TPA: hypothetical protein PKX27_07280 [Bacteroidales bacterium]|nr:hypothetical protein [Bacteroidales bacterium]HPM87766.1 hypothetical protein [Bacteroidales bacterium]
MKMINWFCLILCFSVAFTLKTSGQENYNQKIVVKWLNEKPSGYIEVSNGELEKISLLGGRAKIKGNKFDFSSTGSDIIEVSLKNARIDYGSGATIVSVYNGPHSFSFFLRDVTNEYPIYIPEYNVVVSLPDDKRTYLQTSEDILNSGFLTKLEKIDNEPEESFDSAASHTRNQVCPVWLGISRDIRLFELGFSGEMSTITPRMASSSVLLPETNNTSTDYSYMTGRGVGVEQNISRRLDEGILPILHTTLKDEDIEYKTTSFVSFESSLLNKNKAFGTHFLVADHYSAGHMFTPDQKELLNPLLEKNSFNTEETVLYFRAEAINTASVPRYAFFRTLRPGSGWWEKFKYSYDRETGLSGYSPDRIFGISKLNGKPLPNEEIAVLLQPGDTAVFEFYLPHNPVSRERALRLAGQSFSKRLAECRNFWKEKLNDAARIKLPEKRIEEMVQAGLLHLDLITYGIEPEGTLAPCIGVYSPIGTESSPIIQFYCSMGLHDIARRSLMYFLDKQHEDGMIQNFGGYMVETGAALWSMGEYFRYTRDTAWVNDVKLKLLKSCDFLLKWREKNKKADLEGKGYGMIDGKVADPEDQYHQFMLNAYGYLGLSRIAEILTFTDKENAGRLKNEAESWKKDIRTSLINSMEKSPVVPAGDGTWCPTVPPWTEAESLRLLYNKPETFLSHGTFTISDALLGPLYLIFCEVLEPAEEASLLMLKYHSEMMYQRNAAFSQPYYSRHNWIQLKLGLIKPFLKTYYNTFSALADRETYTFWEHLYQASVHKTHEEAWFLMETRWMLFLEEGNTLKLLQGIPRRWLEDGKVIEIKNASTYFGDLSFTIRSNVAKGFIEANIECDSDLKPDRIIIRFPHPAGKHPVKIIGGTYDPANEIVTVRPFTGKTSLRLEY